MYWYIKLSIYKDSEIWQNSDFALVYINQNVIAFLIDNQSKWYLKIQNTMCFRKRDIKNQIRSGFGFTMIIETVLGPFGDVLKSMYYQIYIKIKMH